MFGLFKKPGDELIPGTDLTAAQYDEFMSGYVAGFPVEDETPIDVNNPGEYYRRGLAAGQADYATVRQYHDNQK